MRRQIGGLLPFKVILSWYTRLSSALVDAMVFLHKHPGWLELVALVDPIEPAFNRLPRLLAGVQDLQLRQRHAEPLAFPSDHHEHLACTFLLRRQADDLDLIPNLEGRDRSPGTTAGEEGKGQGVLEVVIPAQGTLFFVMSINDDFHGDALFARFIPREFRHRPSSDERAEPAVPVITIDSAAHTPRLRRRDHCSASRLTLW